MSAAKQRGLFPVVTLANHHIDDCVWLVTAFDSFADLKNTSPTYAPKFYWRASTRSEEIAQRRVVNAFNAWNHHTNQGRPRAFIAKATGSAA